VKDNIYLIKYKTFHRRFTQPIRFYFDILNNYRPIDLYPHMMALFKKHIQPMNLFDKYLPKLNQNPTYEQFYAISAFADLSGGYGDKEKKDPLMPLIKQYLMS